MGKNEKTGSKVGHIASQGLKNPSSLTNKEIKTLAASALTQRPDHKKPTKKN
jgi:hypothetical protein